MALSQDSTSFQPSELFAKILPCFRWPPRTARVQSLLGHIDTNYDVIHFFATITMCTDTARSPASEPPCTRDQRKACRVPGYRPASTAELGEAGPYLAYGFFDQREARGSPLSLLLQRDVVARRASCNVQGGHLAAPPLPHHRAYGSRTTAVPIGLSGCRNIESGETEWKSKWWLRSAAWTAGCPDHTPETRR